ncbi:MAG: recombinase family protein [Oscillospiraceae bacterium]|nr:recombinase family protein [Oscillospiraceae bacterium]
MNNYKFGYARVSTEEQSLDRQVDMLTNYGVDKIYSEKITGTKRERPELHKMLERLSEGDTVVTESLSRLGRSTKNLIELMELFNKKGVNLVSLKENIDTTTPTGKLMFTLISAISQFERDCLAERTKEGLAAARARGRKGGRPRVDVDMLEKAKRLYRSKEYSIKEISKLTGISRMTLYRHIKGS